MIPQPGGEEFGIYIHIPYCTRKCGYCHFYVTTHDSSSERALVQAIEKQWRHWRSQCIGKRLVSLYFGGGTPSLLAPSTVEALITAIGCDSSVEVTLEANPESLDPQRAADFSTAGINRLSIGVQSLDDDLLKLLTRTHTAQQACDAVAAAAAAIPNVTIDLMYDIPNQTRSSWQQTLATAAALPIQHLSLYNLTIEPGTAFHRRRDQLRIPSATADMYSDAVATLEAAGLEQYEVSAFAKRGAYSRHNSGYWLGRPFIGLGPSAFSDWNGRRFQQAPHLRNYCAAIEEKGDATTFSEQLDPAARERELQVLALRLKQGTSIASPSSILDTLVDQGLLLFTPPDHYRLSRRGFLFYDEVAAALI